MQGHDSIQLITRLGRVLREPQLYRQLLRLKDSSAQALLDTFQLLLDTPHVDTRLRRSLIAATQRLSSKSGLYPVCYELKGVTQTEAEPVTAGGFADIYRAEFEGQVVCLKVIRLYQDSQLEHLLKQFSKEVILWGQLSHPNVLPMYGLYRLKNRLCLVAPWMENGDIAAYLKQNPKADRPSLCADVAQGLRYLHENGIVHGDLKGPNILIDGTGRACLSDFGISGVSDSNIVAWTSQSSVASKGGSVRWQAPELLDMENDEAVKNSTFSDVYALGCVFYEIFTGNVPFNNLSRDTTVILQIQRGSRPSRPLKSDFVWQERGLTERIWDLIEDCWKNSPIERPKAEQVLQRLLPTPLHGPSEKLTLGQTLSPVHFRVRMSSTPMGETSKSISNTLLDKVIQSLATQRAMAAPVLPRTNPTRRLHACPQCNKVFPRNSVLNQHLRTHGRGHYGPVGGGLTLNSDAEEDDTSGHDADVSSGSSSDTQQEDGLNLHKHGVAYTDAPLRAYTLPAFYISPDPSSTHSSPQSYSQELEISYTPYPQQNVYSNNTRLLQMKSTTYGPLHVSTSDTSLEHDPNKRTARPSNAYPHTLFHAQTMPLPPQSHSVPMEEDSLSQNTNPVKVLTVRVLHYASSTPGLSGGLTRPLKPLEQDRLAQLDRLKFFLATAPSRWDTPGEGDQPKNATSLNGQSLPNSYPSLPPSNGLGIHHHGGPDGQISSHPPLNRFPLPSGEYVSCVLWNGLYHITGADIVRALVFRFEAFGRPVRNIKKFEQGVFSDLRNLKPGVDACLEEAKSPFLDLLFKYQCIRTQKKQKVFYWFSVPHDRLFLDALERDLKREKMGQEPTTVIAGEPAMSFTYDPKKSLYEQFSEAQTSDGEGELNTAVRIMEEGSRMESVVPGGEEQHNGDISTTDESDANVSHAGEVMANGERGNPAALQAIGLGRWWLGGSSSYKVRKKGPEREDEKRGRSVLGDSHGRFGSVSLSRERDDPFRGSESVSSADMFNMQARGELLAPDGPRKPSVGPYYEAGQLQMQAQRFLTAGSGHTHGRSQEQLHRHTYPLASPPATTASALSSGYSASFGQQQDAHEGAPVQTKAFVCPLFLCGRMFKRMEHLKRHVRTHTMKRRYSCPQCNKKFSRSDNLNQHLRTHGRRHSGPVGAGATLGLDVAEWIDNSGDDADRSSGGSTGGWSTSTGTEHDASGVESDYDEMFGGGMVMDFNTSMIGGSSGLRYGGDIDPQSCEEQVPGDLHDMSSDEDSMLTLNQGFPQDVYYPAQNGLGLNGQQQGGFDPNWALRPQPSPAFSNVSAPSPPPGVLGNICKHNNRNSAQNGRGLNGQQQEEFNPNRALLPQPSPAFSNVNAPSPHADALGYDFKHEKIDHEPSIVIVSEPALSFKYDPKYHNSL